jgi:hypothetical protein
VNIFEVDFFLRKLSFVADINLMRNEKCRTEIEYNRWE